MEDLYQTELSNKKFKTRNAVVAAGKKSNPSDTSVVMATAVVTAHVVVTTAYVTATFQRV